MNGTRVWECPECGSRFVTPSEIYQAVCSCVTYSSAILTPMAPVMLRTVNMIDITDHPGEWKLRAVPDMPGG